MLPPSAVSEENSLGPVFHASASLAVYIGLVVFNFKQVLG